MILHHLRTVFSDRQTRGLLVLDGNLFSLLLEDTVRVLNSEADKVAGKTAIPAGIYEIQVSYSKRFQKETVEVLGVPYFQGIRYHAGVTVEDTLGCPLLRPLYTGSLQGPVLTDRLTTVLKQALGPHLVQIIDGKRA